MNIIDYFAQIKIDTTGTISDIINLILLFLTMLGLIVAAFELGHNKKINRASLAKELYWTLYDDPDIRSIFYRIEWSNYEIEDYGNAERDDEQKLDKLLSFLEIVCSMYYRRVFTRKDIRLFDYELNRVCSHPCVQAYWKFLDEWQSEQKIGDSFVNLKRYYQSRNSMIYRIFTEFLRIFS